MYKVTTHCLSDDFKSADAAFDEHHLGIVSAQQLAEILEKFRGHDRVVPIEADPRIDIQASSGRFSVRCSAGKLFLYDNDSPDTGSSEHSPDEIIRYLTPRSTVAEEKESLPLEQKSHRPSATRYISVAMLAVGLALNGYTIYSAFYIDDINVAPPLTLITDKGELQNQIDGLSGTFATGVDKGDRNIVIESTGSLRLQELASEGQVRNETRHTFSLGRRGQKLVVAIKPKGQIEVNSRDTLLLYGDTYRRIN